MHIRIQIHKYPLDTIAASLHQALQRQDIGQVAMDIVVIRIQRLQHANAIHVAGAVDAELRRRFPFRVIPAGESFKQFLLQEFLNIIENICLRGYCHVQVAEIAITRGEADDLIAPVFYQIAVNCLINADRPARTGMSRVQDVFYLVGHLKGEHRSISPFCIKGIPDDMNKLCVDFAVPELELGVTDASLLARAPGDNIRNSDHRKLNRVSFVPCVDPHFLELNGLHLHEIIEEADIRIAEHTIQVGNPSAALKEGVSQIGIDMDMLFFGEEIVQPALQIPGRIPLSVNADDVQVDDRLRAFFLKLLVNHLHRSNDMMHVIGIDQRNRQSIHARREGMDVVHDVAVYDL